MTWQELGDKIAQMTEKEKQQEVRCLEGYDSFQIWHPEIVQCLEKFKDEEGVAIEAGDWYLE